MRSCYPRPEAQQCSAGNRNVWPEWITFYVGRKCTYSSTSIRLQNSMGPPTISLASYIPATSRSYEVSGTLLYRYSSTCAGTWYSKYDTGTVTHVLLAVLQDTRHKSAHKQVSGIHVWHGMATILCTRTQVQCPMEVIRVPGPYKQLCCSRARKTERDIFPFEACDGCINITIRTMRLDCSAINKSELGNAARSRSSSIRSRRTLYIAQYRVKTELSSSSTREAEIYR